VPVDAVRPETTFEGDPVSFVVTDARTGNTVLAAGIDVIETVAVTVSPVPVERYV
jgi:hypothetical protein